MGQEGVYWSLHYLYNIFTYVPPQQPRKSSNSLPIPQIEISLYQGPGSTTHESPSGSTAVKDNIEVLKPSFSSLLTESPFHPIGGKSAGATSLIECKSSEKKKKFKMADLRAFVDTEMFSKSDRAILMSLAGEFMSKASTRLQELFKKQEIQNLVNF